MSSSLAEIALPISADITSSIAARSFVGPKLPGNFGGVVFGGYAALLSMGRVLGRPKTRARSVALISSGLEAHCLNLARCRFRGLLRGCSN
jgi:hypothetical protein